MMIHEVETKHGRIAQLVMTLLVVASTSEGFIVRNVGARGADRILQRRSITAVSSTIVTKDTVVQIQPVAKIVEETKNAFDDPIFKVFDFLLSIPVVHDVLFGVYRMQVVEKSEKMGLPWTALMNKQWDALPQLKALADKVKDPKVIIPEYFYAPIHAYKDGNLCWESALEEDLWSKLMIAPLYKNALDGDVQMRQQWLTITNRAVQGSPKTATDLGCGTGLSMYMLDAKWPSIEKVTGVDLSTYKLAVCQEKKSEMEPSKASKYTIIHAPAESTPVDADSQDMASLCLVAHESPKWVSESIFQEAYRILKPGGIFTMLDLDKENLGNLLTNPFVTAIYKRTEPYMAEFLKLDPMVDLVKAGFDVVEVNTLHSDPSSNTLFSFSPPLTSHTLSHTLSHK